MCAREKRTQNKEHQTFQLASKGEIKEYWLIGFETSGYETLNRRFIFFLK